MAKPRRLLLWPLRSCFVPDARRSIKFPALPTSARWSAGAHRLRYGDAVLPASATPDAARLVATRGARGFADGVASVLLASYLSRLGFSPLQIGAIGTATLLGSATLMLAAGPAGPPWP